MATAYHLEALRKQRMLERMAGAQIRLEQAELGDHHHCCHHHHHHSHQQAKRSRTTSSQSQGSLDAKKSKSSQSSSAASAASRPSPNPSPGSAEKKSSSRTHSATSQSVHRSGTNQSSQSSPHPLVSSGTAQTTSSPGASMSDRSSMITMPVKKGVAVGTPDAVTSDAASTSNRSKSSCSYSCSHGTCSKCVSGTCSMCGNRSGAASRQTRSRNSTITPTGSAAAEMKADAIRNDLHKQEYFLRDSNLVMGNISVEEEMDLRNQQ